MNTQEQICQPLKDVYYKRSLLDNVSIGYQFTRNSILYTVTDRHLDGFMISSSYGIEKISVGDMNFVLTSTK